MPRKDHKSSQGCCVCGTKSSSSHFTQSERYARFLPGCFRLPVDTVLRPDICNPCVLYVKRYVKASPTERARWDKSSVVDSKVGPGSKNTFKVPEPLTEEEINRRKRKLSVPRLTLNPDALPPARSLVPAKARVARVERPYTRSRRPVVDSAKGVNKRRCYLTPQKHTPARVPDPCSRTEVAVIEPATEPTLYMHCSSTMPENLLGLPTGRLPSTLSQLPSSDVYWPPVELPDGRLLFIGQWSGHIRIDEPKNRQTSTSSVTELEPTSPRVDSPQNDSGASSSGDLLIDVTTDLSSDTSHSVDHIESCNLSPCGYGIPAVLA